MLLSWVMRSTVMGDAIYFRASDDLREALETYRADRGLTLSGGVVDLVEVGLVAASDGPSIAKLQNELLELRAQLAEKGTQIAEIGGELKRWQLCYRALEEHLRRTEAGTCPHCGKSM